MDYKELRQKLYESAGDGDRVEALTQLDDLVDKLQAELEDVRRANALLFAKYGAPEKVEEKPEIKQEENEIEEPIDIKDIIFNDNDEKGDEE